MKKITKICLSVLILISASKFCLTKLDNYLPQLSVQVILDKMINLEYETYVKDFLPPLEAHEKELVDTILSRMTYEIVDSKRIDDVAFVALNITTINLEEVISNQKNVMVKKVFKNWKSSISDLVEGGIQKLGINSVLNMLKDPSIEKKYQTTQVTIKLEKQNAVWIPILTEDVINAIVGYELSLEEIINGLQ